MKALAWGVAVVGLWAGTARAETPLTIDEAVKIALAHNERAQIAELNVTVADANVQRTRSALLPDVTLSATNSLRPRDDPFATASARLSASQPLFEPSVYPRLDAAKRALASQRMTSIDDRRKLAFDAARAFIAVLLADQVVQAATRKLGTAKANLADTEAQVKAQLVSTNDTTRAQISLSSATRELAADKGKYDAALVELGFVLNAPIGGELATPATLLASSERPLGSIDTLVAQSIARRPDLAAKKLTALAAHDSAREPRRAYLPTLGVSAQVDASSSAKTALEPSVALTASWNIYDGGSRAADIRARDAQAVIADLNASQLARSIEADVRQAAVELASSQAALVSARDARDAARKGADEAAILYRQGLAKAIELLDANDQRFIAEVNYATAEFDVASAYLGLRAAMGLDPVEP